jgi:site-specific DNA-cytosine methylase
VVVNQDEYLWRKLTPLECERLQTMPDNYTNHVSKTQRYKMIGNGWTIDVIAHILSSVELDPTKEWTKMYNNSKEYV